MLQHQNPGQNLSYEQEENQNVPLDVDMLNTSMRDMREELDEEFKPDYVPPELLQETQNHAASRNSNRPSKLFSFFKSVAECFKSDPSRIVMSAVWVGIGIADLLLGAPTLGVTFLIVGGVNAARVYSQWKAGKP